jgi:hypothetical protein
VALQHGAHCTVSDHDTSRQRRAKVGRRQRRAKIRWGTERHACLWASRENNRHGCPRGPTITMWSDPVSLVRRLQ